MEDRTRERRGDQKKRCESEYSESVFEKSVLSDLGREPPRRQWELWFREPRLNKWRVFLHLSSLSLVRGRQ